MSQYTTYDFTESLGSAGIELSAIESVVAAHGVNGDGNEWSGGFLLKMKDGQYCYISGWCDYTGWGCQDGVDVKYFGELPDKKTLSDDEWDDAPADLNNELKQEAA